ncbi:hypothetical protein SUDANB15_00449 [Streptomyces sp. enrichment culture]|uniref:hypothetical protein n=1 Tax=Streptomyces sp. enrichment culture TaxID=1795815 RepID=UPI003F558D47
MRQHERSPGCRRPRPRPDPRARADGRELPGLVLDIDAALVTCRSDEEQAAPACKHGFGCHSLLCFPDNTGAALAALPSAGNAAADHITVLDAALVQVPDAHRHDVLIRADGAGDAKAS